MDIVQQYMLDSYRAARHEEPPPPPPGRHDREVWRALRRHLSTGRSPTTFTPRP